ncbi:MULTISPECIES: hypothetical protein [unclassified Mycobacterium]|uniref:hypothetical protein n=1 Tax=unclassified Mycobacterium TaxID=2642494 RepID=UPI0029C8AB67|nr:MULTISPECIES: hypothetical protein [unclassified Mycobacterium]
MSSLEPGSSRARQQPEETSERRLTGWQRAVRWVLWLTFLGVAVWKSQTVYFSGLEWLALAAAIGFSIWCMARPLGGPKVELTKPAHLLGTFVSRTSWGLLLFGTVLTIGGVGGAGAAVYDLATGRATFGEVAHDIAIFIEGWIVETMTRGGFDGELEKTHAYALFLLLIPGLIMVWINLVPLLKRGAEFRVEADGSVMVRLRDSWEPLLEYQYSSVTADGSTIAFAPPPDGPPAVTLPQARVFCRENGARLKPELSAEFFTGLLAVRGFEVAASNSSSFTARRK